METDLNILVIEPDENSRLNIENILSSINIGSCHNAALGSSIYQLEPFSPDIAILGPSIDNENCILG